MHKRGKGRAREGRGVHGTRCWWSQTLAHGERRGRRAQGAGQSGVVEVVWSCNGVGDKVVWREKRALNWLAA
jgi:hypothetical protein